MRVVPYNRENAINYAREWAFRRNPSYYDFNDLGGDCTNFVSQCLYAGSGIMNYTPNTGWYYISINNRSPSWTGVPFLYDFLVNNQSVGPFGRVVEYWQTEPGDIVQLGRSNGEFYHSMIIIKTTPEILLASHTNDAFERPLSSYTFDTARFIKIDGVRFWQ